MSDAQLERVETTHPLRQYCWMLRNLVTYGDFSRQDKGDLRKIMVVGESYYAMIIFFCDRNEFIASWTWDYVVDDTAMPHSFDDRRTDSTNWRRGCYSILGRCLTIVHHRNFRELRPLTAEIHTVEFGLQFYALAQPTPTEMMRWLKSLRNARRRNWRMEEFPIELRYVSEPNDGH